MTDQLSADIDARFAAGPPTQAPVVGIRDLIVCATDSSFEVPMEEVHQHLPIGEERIPGVDRDDVPFAVAVDLGDNISIERLDDPTAELVMNACTPRGHYFLPVRQFGQRYSFVRRVSMEEREERHFGWDTTGSLNDALMLSRIVPDNGSVAYLVEPNTAQTLFTPRLPASCACRGGGIRPSRLLTCLRGGDRQGIPG